MDRRTWMKIGGLGFGALCTGLQPNLAQLQAAAVPFRVSVCGESFRDVPVEMRAARRALGDRVAHWGFIENRNEYLALLSRAHVVVSTARHEFFGLSVLEATAMGARPLVPDRLCYPELFPAEYRYDDLFPALQELCQGWTASRLDLRAARPELLVRHASVSVVAQFHQLLRQLLEPAVASADS